MTKFEAAKKEAASYHKDLLDLRKQIMQATQKFDRGNQKEGKKGRKRREEDEPWKGSEDVEKLSQIFTTYLTSMGNRRKD